MFDMHYLYEATTVIILAVIISRVHEWLYRGVKRRKSETQLSAFIADYLNREHGTGIGLEQFHDTKRLLMLDWLDGHPRHTRIDFCRLFDQMIDGHCESFAINEYLQRRQARNAA